MDNQLAWQKFPKRAVHLDFHTPPGIKDLGRDFNPREFAKTLLDAGVQYVNVFAKCNMGFSYFPTKCGTIYPGLKRDLLGEMVSACHDEGIKVAAYFNVGLSHEQALKHRDWCVVNKLGQVYQFDKMDHWFRTMCFFSGYRDFILEMIDEVTSTYPVDGLIFDSMNTPPCYGIECIEEAEKRGLNPKNDADMNYLAFLTTLSMRDAISAKIAERRNDVFTYYLGIESCYQPTHVELEVLPQGGWGYDYLPARIRYIRTLGKPYSTMTARFHRSWGDLGGIRPEAALMHDCLNSVVNGGKCCIGDHLHPFCKLEPAVYKMIGSVYGKLAKLDPWTDNAKPQAEIAIFANWFTRYQTADENENCGYAMRGIARMLMELKQQFDIVDAEADISRYSLVIIPDYSKLTAQDTQKLTDFMAKGGKVISTAWGGLNEDGTDFALPAFKDAMTFVGNEKCHFTFIHPAKELADNMPDIGTTVYEKGVEIAAKNGKVLATLGKCDFNLQDWDYKHEYLYISELEKTDRPLIIESKDGNACHFAFPMGFTYFQHATCAYKTLLINEIARMLPKPMLKLENFPSYGQATITRQDARTMLHLLCYVPEKRGKVMEIVEEPSIALDVQAQVRLDGPSPKKVYFAPDMEEIPFTVEDGYVKFAVPVVKGYKLIVME